MRKKALALLLAANLVGVLLLPQHCLGDEIPKNCLGRPIGQALENSGVRNAKTNPNRPMALAGRTGRRIR